VSPSRLLRHIARKEQVVRNQGVGCPGRGLGDRWDLPGLRVGPWRQCSAVQGVQVGSESGEVGPIGFEPMTNWSLRELKSPMSQSLRRTKLRALAVAHKHSTTY
jgi:hypothetical protein